MTIGRRMLRLKNVVGGRLMPGQMASAAARLFFTPRRLPLKEWEKEAEAQGVRMQVNGDLSLLRWGDSGPRALLVHGWESRATHMANLGKALASSGFQVFALDGPAHGQSAGRQSNLVAFSEAVQRVHRELGPFDAIVGHSMGGSAVALALTDGVTCQRAVLISSPAAILGVMVSFADFIGLPALARKRFVQEVGVVAGRPASDLDLTRILPDVTVSGLVVHDQDDVEIPCSNAESIAGSWPGARLVLTQGLGHRRILHSEEVARLVVEELEALLYSWDQPPKIAC